MVLKESTLEHEMLTTFPSHMLEADVDASLLGRSVHCFNFYLQRSNEGKWSELEAEDGTARFTRIAERSPQRYELSTRRRV